MRNHFGCLGGEGVCEVYHFRCFITAHHLVDRERAATHQPPTNHPPIDHPTITAVQQQYNSSSGAARTNQSITTAYSSNTTVQRYTCGPVIRQELGGICTFFTILYLSRISASRRWERLFMPPARGVGTCRRLGRRGHRGLVCGAGVARACGRQGPGGERQSAEL